MNKIVFEDEHKVMAAQTVRLFASSLLPWKDYYQANKHLSMQKLLNSTILLTTDADILPLSLSMFNIDTSKSNSIGFQQTEINYHLVFSIIQNQTK